MAPSKPRAKPRAKAKTGLGSNSRKQDSSGLNDESKTVPESDTPLFFFKPGAKYGEFCQWFPATFTVSKSAISSLIGHPCDPSDIVPGDSITFNCAEQFMMYCKAARFHDEDRQALVLASSNPMEQKAHGRATIGFTDASWDAIKSSVVVMGNIAKFGQDASLSDGLLATGDRLLVEAAARDRVWGVGYSEKHAMSCRKYWGENRLGKALMAVRDHLRKEEAAQKEPWEVWECWRRESGET